MNKIFWNGFCFVAVVTALVIYACANRGYPEGGEKDTTPPKVIKEVPESFSTDFKGKYIDIYFNEYVQLKEINNKFVMSPPAKKKARVSLRGKYVRVTFQDSLKPETTYTLDFADAIVDNNEANPLGFYRYVFSTGPQLDSMELSGQVIDMESQLPVLGAMVLFYENHADSAAISELPNYVARTDSAGMFRVTNIKNTTYRVLAIDDANRDNKFLPEEEKVGFIDSLVTTVSFPMVVYDTIHPDTMVVEGRRTKKGMELRVLSQDTIVRRDYTAFGPSNLFIPMFNEEKTQLYLVDKDRKERERLDFIFSIPADNQLNVRLRGVHLLDKEDQGDWFIEERSAGRDTIQLWIKDSLVYKIDSLTALAAYLRTDTLGKRELFVDTTRFYFKDKPEPKKRKKDQDSIPEIKFMEVNVGVGGTVDLNKGIRFEFDRPIREEGLKNIQLFEKVDTIWTPTDFTMKHDSLKIRRYELEKKWKPETEYKLTVDSMGIYSIYGLYNNKIEKTFKTKAEEEYGKIFVQVKNAETPVIIQLYQGDKEVKVLDERWIDKDGKVMFDYLNEGKYMIRGIIDRNGNKKWDTGNYMKHIQPEEIKYLPVEINLKKNFDVEQEFDASKTYKREDPSKKKNVDNKDNRRNRSNR
jgi:lipoprotein